MQRWSNRLVGTAVAAACMSWAGAGRAEYVENQMSRDVAALTLGTSGAAALGFDIASIVYLAGGSGDQLGRIITGVGSLTAGAGLIVGGTLSLSTGGVGHIPGGADNMDSEEGRAMTEARVIAGVDIGLAVASIGVGIATLVTFEGDSEQDGSQTSRWALWPIIMADDGAGIGLGASFQAGRPRGLGLIRRPFLQIGWSPPGLNASR